MTWPMSRPVSPSARPWSGSIARNTACFRTTSGLSGLSICVAPVAFSFTSCLVLQDALAADLVSQLARIDFSSGCGSNGGISCCCFSCSTILFFKFRLISLRPALFTSFDNQTPLRLFGFASRFGSFLGGTEGLNKSCLGVHRSAATFGVIAVHRSFQISIPCDGFRRAASGLSCPFRSRLGCRGHTVLQFLGKPSLSQSLGLFVAGDYDRVQVFNRTLAFKKLRLGFTKSGFGLLAKYAVVLGHGVPRIGRSPVSGYENGQATCLALLGLMLSTVPVHPWSRESRYRIYQAACRLQADILPDLVSRSMS